jgi:putative membrane protein
MSMSVRHGFLVAAALALGLGAQVGCDKSGEQSKYGDQGGGTAQTATPSREDQQPPPSGGRDAGFMATVAQANFAEVDAGRLALKKSSNPDVKKFAQHMIDDHTQANSDLADLAHKKGMDLPSKADEAHQKELARLAEMSGAEFDRAYMTMMVNDHVKAVSLFEKNAEGAADPEVKAFAKKMLPTLQEHLKMARDMSAKLGGASSNP